MPRKRGIARDLLDAVDRYAAQMARRYWLHRLHSALSVRLIDLYAVDARQHSRRVHQWIMTQESHIRVPDTSRPRA